LQLQELPFAPLGDAANELEVTGGWSKDLADGYARRVLARVARHAPDLPTKLLYVDIVI
jgi:phytoene dehydrogenase-like protein